MGESESETTSFLLIVSIENSGLTLENFVSFSKEENDFTVWVHA